MKDEGRRETAFRLPLLFRLPSPFRLLSLVCIFILHPSSFLPVAFDYLIVGAGFAGSVLADRLARVCNKKVLVVDRRNHIAGNAYDHYNEAGILIHKYGPHIFHTNSREIFDYLSQFTQWRGYEHRVLASVDGQLLPMPINLDTINQMYGLNLTSFQVE